MSEHMLMTAMNVATMVLLGVRGRGRGLSTRKPTHITGRIAQLRAPAPRRTSTVRNRLQIARTSHCAPALASVPLRPSCGHLYQGAGMKRILIVALAIIACSLAYVPSASATIHPIVESFDCANAQAFAQHPLGDPADPIGQTPGVGSHSDQSSLRALTVITDDNTDLSSPALFGHKLDGQCGHSGP
jgi:hypothetical protein